MGNGALYMADEEKKKNECQQCGVDTTDYSYFIRVGEGMDSKLVEVCPECHHYYCYGTEGQKQNYKERRNIK